MRIVIDMQGAQTESRFRGIGRYTMAFAKAVVRDRGEHEVFLVLSGLFQGSIEPIRAAFEGLLPQENIRVWYSQGPVREAEVGNDARREIAESMREAFIASLNPDVVHLTSLFEGFVDDAVTSIGRFDKTTFVSVTLHDLIPLLSPKQYLEPNRQYSKYYLEKIDSLKNASLFLAISESSRKEAIECLNIDSARVINTYEGVEDHFCKINFSEGDRKALLAGFDINRPFVLYTGGADERKNLPRLIEAYASLNKEIRENTQLVFAGKMPASNVEQLKNTAKQGGLKSEELIFTGHISEGDLVALYNLCKLYVFPSWHEGFGLPALEAMACGAPVIGANTTSLPEVIGLSDALFDPFNTASITEKLEQGLTDESFRARVCGHAERQVSTFSWERTAKRAIAAWENNVSNKKATDGSSLSLVGKAWQQLLGEISRRIDSCRNEDVLTIAQHLAHNNGVGMRRQLFLDISELWQRDAATGVQRVVRSYLNNLLENPPKDFVVCPVYATRNEGYRYATRYLAAIQGAELRSAIDLPIRWQRGDLFFGLDMQHHVQLAQADHFASMRRDGVVVKFLVHDLLPIQLADYFKDNSAKELHEAWLAMIAQQGEAVCVSKATADAYSEWLEAKKVRRNPRFQISWVHNGADIGGSSPTQGVPENGLATLASLKAKPTFLSVSTIEPRKAQAQILDAIEILWSEGVDVNLVFVGQEGWKVDSLINRIVSHPENGNRLFWLKGINDEYLEHVYSNSACLIAASLNEGFGLPLIEAARHQIPIIARDIPVFREVAGESAFYFNGKTGTELAEAIKRWLKQYKEGKVPDSGLMKWNTWQQSTEQLKTFLIDQNYPRKQLLVDISELVQRDAKSGIQRVVRETLYQWLQSPPDGYQVQPVYATLDKQGYRYARRFTCQFMGERDIALEDEPVDAFQGDVFFVLDMQPQVQIKHRDYYQYLRNNGVFVGFLVHDLLCIQYPEYFPPRTGEGFSKWLEVVTETDFAICVSKTVADDLKAWLNERDTVRLRKFEIGVSHNGAHFRSSGLAKVSSGGSTELMNTLAEAPSFLMVGTVEPRKGHAQVLDAFEKLWAGGIEANLVIVGKQGWMVERLVERLRSHPQEGKKLHWLEGIDDAYLEAIYSGANCLIAASYGEGFGLPLIEAAQHRVPIIARDIPVFREVAGDYAYYFSQNDPEGLASAIQDWLSLYEKGQHPLSDDMPWLTWTESAQQLLDLIIP